MSDPVEVISLILTIAGIGAFMYAIGLADRRKP